MLSSTTGGGFGGEEATEAAGGAGPSNEAPSELGVEHFPRLLWGIFSQEDMTSVLGFKYRLWLTSFVKVLLALPCMSQNTGGTSAAADPKALSVPLGHASRAFQQASMEQLFSFVKLTVATTEGQSRGRRSRLG